MTPEELIAEAEMGSPEGRFLAAIVQKGLFNGTPCWQWTGKLTSDQYATFHADRRGHRAHRWAYERWVGPIPKGLHIDHLCRNRACVNPAHLEAVTNRENVLRGEGTSAVNARKTHCHRGHEFTPESMYVDARGKRVCKPCRKLDRIQCTEKKRQGKELMFCERCGQRVIPSPFGGFRHVVNGRNGATCGQPPSPVNKGVAA